MVFHSGLREFVDLLGMLETPRASEASLRIDGLRWSSMMAF
jgi:hypothetical protein